MPSLLIALGVAAGAVALRRLRTPPRRPRCVYLPHASFDGGEWECEDPEDRERWKQGDGGLTARDLFGIVKGLPLKTGRYIDLGGGDLFLQRFEVSWPDEVMYQLVFDVELPADDWERINDIEQDLIANMPADTELEWFDGPGPRRKDARHLFIVFEWRP